MDSVVHDLLARMYPDASGLSDRVMELVERYRTLVAERRSSERSGAADAQAGGGLAETFPLTSADSILITYGDSLQRPDEVPLVTLRSFLSEVCDGAISGVHVLPFCPWSSDDGFSVIDFRAVDPTLGSWKELEALGSRFRLMADLVLNHCSAESEWFSRFLAREEPYRDYFITVDPATDLSDVVRPRALPLLTEFESAAGPLHVWTTFSADQVDLNWSSPEVLVEMLDVFLSYLAHGARVVRLDAIAYLWKELGTSCIHHPNTHRAVKLMRRVMELFDPEAILITETNVPHAENLSYFGDGDEAHMVYNFSLPPLLLDAVIRGDATHLSRWAASLEDPGPGASFFNFCASHDGIGLLPTQGILSEEERAALIATVEERGGRISYKATPGGAIPYEMNVNYLSAAADPNLPDAQRARIFLATQAVMLALAGVPGIYIHSLLGSVNWDAGVAELGYNRAINRRKLDLDEVVIDLAEPESLRAQVFEGYGALLAARAASSAFHPKSPQRVVQSAPGLFALLRGPGPAYGPDPATRVLCLHNLSPEPIEFRDRRDTYQWPEDGVVRELVGGDLVYPTAEGSLFSLELAPYEVAWLEFAG